MISLPTNKVITKPPVVGRRRVFLTPLPTAGDFLFVIDNSSLERWKRCPTAAQNYTVLGREAHAKDAALVFGGALHIGIERFVRNESDEAQVRGMVKYMQDNPTPTDECRTINTAVEVLGHYRARTKLPDYHLEFLSDDKGLILERAFELPLGVVQVNDWVPESYLQLDKNTNNVQRKIENEITFVFIKSIHIAWSGRIDALVRYNGKVAIMDNKTTRVWTDAYVDGYRISSQTIGYCWASSQLWPDFGPVLDFILNAIHLKKFTPGVPLLAKGPKGGQPPLQFYRAYYDYTPSRLTQWATDTLVHIEDFLHCVIRGCFPMNYKSCIDKFGKCQYFDVCTVDQPEVRQKLLLSDRFRPVTWNPTDERE